MALNAFKLNDTTEKGNKTRNSGRKNEAEKKTKMKQNKMKMMWFQMEF